MILSRKDNAIMYMKRAELAWQRGDYDEARRSFSRGVEVWQQAAERDHTLDPAARLAAKRFEEFVKDDELFIELLPECKRIIQENPGIVQGALSEKLNYYDDQIRYVLHFAEKQGEIVRKKIGRTYTLHIATRGDEIA